MAISSERFAPDAKEVSRQLDKLADLGGTWKGKGFNLIARPDHVDDTPLYLQLNQTYETLRIQRIGSPIPNRGFGMDDIELNGFTYLQQIEDAETGSALHIEPGIWITQPPTTFPVEKPPPDGQIVARMATIPHGNSVLAQGSAVEFAGPPTLKTALQEYNGSVFPSFNSTPLKAGDPLNAAGSSELLTSPNRVPPPPPPIPFPQYNLKIAVGAATPPLGVNTRTPFPAATPALPPAIVQAVINDPITLLQAEIKRQQPGHTFKGVALNIATQSTVKFFPTANKPSGVSNPVKVSNGGGGAENIPFLKGKPVKQGGPNALTALVYATFWITHVTPNDGAPDFLQLQYAQMTMLNFGVNVPPPPPGAPAPAPGAPAVPPILGWPHISVATLRKSFS